MDLAARWKVLPPGTVDTLAGRVVAGLAAITLAFLSLGGPLHGLGIGAAVFLVDQGGRAFTRSLGSPITWVAGLALDAFRIPPRPVPLVPMRWAVAVEAVWFSAILALVEGGFALQARAVALMAIPVLGAYALTGFCTVGWIHDALAARLDPARGQLDGRDSEG